MRYILKRTKIIVKDTIQNIPLKKKEQKKSMTALPSAAHLNPIKSLPLICATINPFFLLSKRCPTKLTKKQEKI